MRCGAKVPGYHPGYTYVCLQPRPCAAHGTGGPKTESWDQFDKAVAQSKSLIERAAGEKEITPGRNPAVLGSTPRQPTIPARRAKVGDIVKVQRTRGRWKITLVTKASTYDLRGEFPRGGWIWGIPRSNFRVLRGKGAVKFVDSPSIPPRPR